MEKIRHHHLPKCYLKNFCDKKGKIYAYRKSKTTKPLYVTPENIGYQKFYYSQPLPEGGFDNNSLEDVFSVQEYQWDIFMKSLLDGNYHPKNHTGNIYTFMGLQFARGPAYRDAYDLTWVESIKKNYKNLRDSGKLPLLPEKPKKYFRNPTISIDPHRSLSAIPKVLWQIGYWAGFSGFKIYQNMSGVDFLTSDNPIIFFNPNVSEKRIIPYKVNIRNEVEWVFPISQNHLIHGHPSYGDINLIGQIPLSKLDDLEAINRFNRLICRFGYKFIFSRNEEFKNTNKIFLKTSPVPLFQDLPTDIETFYMPKFRFGKVQSKIKWKKKLWL